MLKTLEVHELPAGFGYQLSPELVVVVQDGSGELFVVKNDGVPGFFRVDPPSPGRNVVTETIPNETDHKCGTCGGKVHEPTKRCFSCMQDLKKRGICITCGEQPVCKIGREKSVYCERCAGRKGLISAPGGFGNGPRDMDQREKTSETKFGTSHG